MENKDFIKNKDLSLVLVYRVLLTKDNLVRKNWKANKKYCFCNLDEIIQYLFFDCSFAKFIWRVVGITFGIYTPTSILDMYVHWLNNFSTNIKF
jgi:hypothetical protein